MTDVAHETKYSVNVIVLVYAGSVRVPTTSIEYDIVARIDDVETVNVLEDESKVNRLGSAAPPTYVEV
jgi:hypothetical protein